jgi:hypothetical protein
MLILQDKWCVHPFLTKKNICKTLQINWEKNPQIEHFVARGLVTFRLCPVLGEAGIHLEIK